MALIDFGVLGTLNIPDQHVAQAQIELARIFGPYQTEVWDPDANAGAGGNVPNPETPATFINREMKQRMIDGVKRALIREAQDTAAQSTDTSGVVIDDAV